MTFYIIASLLAFIALSVAVVRAIQHDGSDLPRSLQHPPRSHHPDNVSWQLTRLR